MRAPCLLFFVVLLTFSQTGCKKESAAAGDRERHFGLACGPGTSLRGRESEFDLHDPVGCVRPDGTRHGPFIEDEEFRTPTGSLGYDMAQGEYRDGQRVGAWVVRNQFDGNLVRIDTYSHGELLLREAVTGVREESCEADGTVSVTEIRGGRATQSGLYAASGGHYERISGDGPLRLSRVGVSCRRSPGLDR